MQAAREAVNYVKKSMPYGSVNNPGGWISKSFVGPFISAYQQYKGFKDGIAAQLVTWFNDTKVDLICRIEEENVYFHTLTV